MNEEDEELHRALVRASAQCMTALSICNICGHEYREVRQAVAEAERLLDHAIQKLNKQVLDRCRRKGPVR